MSKSNPTSLPRRNEDVWASWIPGVDFTDEKIQIEQFDLSIAVQKSHRTSDLHSIYPENLHVMIEVWWKEPDIDAVRTSDGIW